MQISELATTSGVPLATVKFYLREGLLPKGAPVSATRAEYGETHRRRLQLITSLTSIPGLPLTRMREILDVVDQWQEFGVIEAIGTAVSALPPYPSETPPPADRAAPPPADRAAPPATATATAGQYPLAEATIATLGIPFDPSYSATSQLETAIRAVTQAGLDWSPEIATRYGSWLTELAADELEPMSNMDPQTAVTYAVLGTALYEPVILAIRRLLHRDLAERRLPAGMRA